MTPREEAIEERIAILIHHDISRLVDGVETKWTEEDARAEAVRRWEAER